MVEIYKGAIGKDDIIKCDGEADALVLFDQEFDHLNSAPVCHEIMRSQAVHLFGFATLGDHCGFVVPGEVQSVGADNILISCPTIPGLSGGAVVCDGSGGVLGYAGGAQLVSDKSFFGAYAFRLEPIAHDLKKAKEMDDHQSSSASTKPDKKKQKIGE